MESAKATHMSAKNKLFSGCSEIRPSSCNKTFFFEPCCLSGLVGLEQKRVKLTWL
jgi:hypothetical protein